MVKWEMIDDKDAPEDLSAMTDDARDKLELLRALKRGKTAKVPVEQAQMRGFKASVTRIAGKHKIPVKVYSEGDHVFIRLTEQPETESQPG